MSSAPHRVFTTSGRAAIGLALEQLGIGTGAMVLVPSYHCPTMVSPIVARGAAPWFFPIRADGAADIDWLARQDLGAVRAVIAAHYFGRPRAMEPLRALCDRLRLALIEDCAHAYFGNAGGRPVGAWGDMAIASLTKFFPVREGGLLVSQTLAVDAVALRPRDRMAALRQWLDTAELGAAFGQWGGWTAPLRGLLAVKNLLRGRSIDGAHLTRLNPDDDGSDGAMPPFDRDLARQQPAALVRWIERRVDRARLVAARRRNYQRLAQGFADARGMRPLEPVLAEQQVPYVFPLWVDEPERCYQPIRRAGVPVFRWDVLWPGVPLMDGDQGLQWSRHVLQIGCHQDLDDADIDAIVDTVRALGAAQ